MHRFMLSLLAFLTTTSARHSFARQRETHEKRPNLRKSSNVQTRDGKTRIPQSPAHPSTDAFRRSSQLISSLLFSRNQYRWG
ncbi:hypothetical protein GGR56DRAFT_623210 [Xylariaceae sp. FL0804]|nr:hypothetical protein GGR56DRAFT_623210 [Xylariaceae sp. FL0804]